MKYLVTGAGGFVGGHLVGDLLERGHDVRAVDIKGGSEWWQTHDVADNMTLDLRGRHACNVAVEGMERVFNLAADMGGIGYISSHRLEPMRSVLINTHLLGEAYAAGVERYLYASSACVYGEGIDTAEENAYPAECEDGYGWEKLFSERMCRHYTEETGLETRVARLHNVYGPKGSWNDGREKAPAAICRKVAEAVESRRPAIEIWGDGTQRRSFMHIGDCIEGLNRIMEGDFEEPLNLGSSQMVSVNELVDKVEEIAGTHLDYMLDLDAPVGVQGRTSDNSLIRMLYDWEPSTPLSLGLVGTYGWIAEQVQSGLRTAQNG